MNTETYLLFRRYLRTAAISLLLLGSVFFNAHAQQAPYFNWVKGLQAYHTYALGSFNWGTSIKTDVKGNVFIAGTFIRSVDFDPSNDGVDSQASNTYLGGYFAKYDSLGQHIWAKTLPTAEVNCLYLDDSGYIYIGGRYYDSTDFDPGPLRKTLPAYGKGDFFVAKYNPAGGLQWVRGSGGDYPDAVNGVFVDKQGNVYITGGMHGNRVDFNERNPGSVLYMTGVLDGFIAKYDRNGNYSWSRHINGINGDTGLDIAQDPSGNIVIGGYSAGAMFDGTPASYVAGHGTNNRHDAFIAKYTSAGTYMWARTIGSPDEDLGYSLAIDKAGNILLSGIYTDTIVFNPSIPSARIASNSYSGNAFVAKFDGNGNYIWAKSISSKLSTKGNAVTTDDSSNVYIGGHFSDTVNFNPGGAPGSIAVAFHQTDMFLLKLKGDGSYIWSKTYGNKGADEINRVYIDQKYNLYFTGYIGRTTVFEPGAGGSVVVNNPNPNDFQNTVFCKYAQVKPVPSAVGTVIPGSLSLHLYPNPAGDQITIAGYKSGSRITAVITDITGKQYLLPAHHSADYITLQTAMLAPGVYFVRCTDGAGQSSTVKFLK